MKWVMKNTTNSERDSHFDDLVVDRMKRYDYSKSNILPEHLDSEIEFISEDEEE